MSPWPLSSSSQPEDEVGEHMKEQVCGSVHKEAPTLRTCYRLGSLEKVACPLVPRAVSQLTALAYGQLLVALFHSNSNNTNGSSLPGRWPCGW